MERRENARPVTSETIRIKANEAATASFISKQVFKASNKWVNLLNNILFVIGHVMRKTSLENLLTTGKFYGKKS